MIELEGLVVALGGRRILDGVTLDIDQGEFVGVLGANGAGKTTMFRAILGVLRPQGGTIRVLGGIAAPGRPGIGYMPQSRAGAAGARLTGWQHVAAAAGEPRWGLPMLRAADRRMVRDCLELVGADALADLPLSSLSGGERQRLLLAQALLGRPRLLLLDEPLMSLDPRRQGEIVALCRRLNRQLGVTVLFSAHELNPLLGAMDRVLYLGGGHAAIGTVDEVITSPVLSRLYGADIDVVRAAGRIFVMSGDTEVERDDHRHPECAHAHPHGFTHTDAAEVPPVRL